MTSAKFERYTRLMLACAAAILVVTAALHGTGFAEIDGHLTHAAMPEIWRAAVRVIWIIYSVHLLLLAALLAYAALPHAAVSSPVLMFCGLVPALDALLLVFYVGGFIATALLGLAAALVFGAVARRTMTIDTHATAPNTSHDRRA